MPPARRGVPKRRGATTRQATTGNRENPLAIDETEVEIVIESIQDANPSINMVINGESGVGKTVLAGGASALPGARVVFCSTEQEGIVSAKRAGSTAELIRAPSWEYAVSTLKWGEANLGPDDWMVFDSGTRMHYLYMRWIMEKVKNINPARDLDIPGLDNHQKIQNGFMRWYDRIIDAPFNSIFITTPMTMEDAEGETRVIPQTFDSKGKVAKYISAQASVILYYDVARDPEGKDNSIIRRVYAQPWPPWFAKDRYSALGPGRRIEDGDFFAMTDIIQAIYKAREEMLDAPTEAAPARPAARKTRTRRAS
jgi:AAA domain